MDHNQLALINLTDSLISSLTASFEQLQVDTFTGNGPINRLPNEMMQLIMVKLELDGDVKKLIRLRLVCTRWRAMVEDYCGQKKSLFVQFDPYQAISDCTSHYFEETFFGFSNSVNFTCLFLSTKISSECLSSLLNMFPNIEQLSIYCYDYNYGNGKYYESTALNNSLRVYINSLDSLKLLDLNGSITAAQLSPALSKLEHFSYGCGRIDDLLQAIAHLGPSCVRANFWEYFVNEQVRQLHKNNPPWLANLTHLRIHFQGRSAESARVVHLLSEQAISLQHLDFDTTACTLKLTPTVLRDLGKLSHLTHLALRHTDIPVSKLEKVAVRRRLTSLTSVLTCKLWSYIDEDFVDFDIINGNQFTRLLSVIFPNLVELGLTFRDLEHNSTILNDETKQEIEQHLGHFANLRKDNIIID